MSALRRWRKALPIAALLLLPTMAACNDDAGPSAAEAGERVALVEGAVTGREDVVQLPDGQLQVSVDPDLGSTLSEDDSVDKQEHRTGADLRYVGVSWTTQTGVGVPSWLRVLLDDSVVPGGDRPTLAVTLVADDERVPLGTPVTDADTPQDLTPYEHLAVAVPAGAEDLSLEIDYSGEVQVLDVAEGALDPGAAAALYDLPAEQAAGRPCGGTWASTTTGPPADVECHQLVLRLPYVAGLGWADDPARPWVVVNASTFLDSYDQGGATYAPEEQQDRTTVGGQAAVRVLSGPSDEQQVDTYAVFAAADDEPVVLLARDVTLGLQRGRGDQRLERTFALRPGLGVPGADTPFGP